MAKNGETSESQAQSQTGDPWQEDQGDPWANAVALTQTHENNAVPESPVSQSFQAPQTEEEDAKTENKGQTDNEDTGARSSKEDSATETKTDVKGESAAETKKEDEKNVSDSATDTKTDVKDESATGSKKEDEKNASDKKDVVERDIFTPDRRASRWPTTYSGTWRSIPSQDWYNDGWTSLGGWTAPGGWWSQNQSNYNNWYWTPSQPRPTWSASPWWSTGTAQPEKEKVVIKMVDTGVVTDTTPAPTKVTAKEATMGTQTDTPITPAAAAAMPVTPTPPAASPTSDRNRDYSAPPEFKGLDNLEHYKK